MLHGCTHMVAVGVKGLITDSLYLFVAVQNPLYAVDNMQS